MRLVAWIVAGITLFAGYLWWTSPIRPVARHFDSPPPMQGVLSVNSALQRAVVEGREQIAGGEDIAMDALGNLYTGSADGKIWQRTTNGQWRVFAQGNPLVRPAGLAVDKQGNLIVCDAFSGLLRVTPQGDITILVDSFNGVRFGLTDDVDIAPDGRIYFTDATANYTMHNYRLEALEGRPSGRFMRYDPTTGETDLLLDDLYFANGVAVAKDGSFVLVNETFAFQTRRVWLSGERAGQSDMWQHNLPGFPDGISADDQGHFWMALYAPRLPALESLQSLPTLKRILGALPEALWPKPVAHGLVLKLDAEGNILQSLHDATGETMAIVTSAERYGDTLYMGSLVRPGIGMLTVQAN